MEELKQQIHGGDIYRNEFTIDFSVNSNPLGPPEPVIEAVRKTAVDMVHYPDIQCQRLVDSLSDYEGIKRDYIICGNGAAELFFMAVLAVRPQKALLAVPTFSEYERALALSNAKPCFYELTEETGFKMREDIIERITPDIDMMFLCNPNNPTGIPVERGLLLQILQKCRECRAVLVLDECFIDFLDRPQDYEMRNLLKEYDNLLIVKAFTKMFCMPGLRLGYGMCSSRALLKKMAAAVQPWNVSVPAQEAGIAALRHSEHYIVQTRQFVKEQREYLKKGLLESGCRVYGSQANYLFFESKPGLYEQALDAGFLIRDCQNYRGLREGYYRIAVRTREENERIITWLRQL